MRTLKHNGMLLQLLREEKPYLTIYLKEGTVAIYSPHTTLLSEAKLVTDGNNNLVTVKVHYGHVVFPKAGNHRALGNVSVEAGDVAYVGGLPAGKNMNTWGGNFKGCLQDIRLDHKHLSTVDQTEGVEMYQTRMENVLPGCQSDDTCKVKQKYCIKSKPFRENMNICDVVFFSSSVQYSTFKSDFFPSITFHQVIRNQNTTTIQPSRVMEGQ